MSSTPQPAQPGILQVLRSETASLHEKLEQDLNLLRPDLDLADYVRFLAGFHDIYSGWEPIAAPILGAEIPALAGFTGKRRLLDEDLAFFGVKPDYSTASLPGLSSLSTLLGSMYVLEGSTLGGQVLLRHFSRQFGIRKGHGASFLDCYGAQTGRMWRVFCGELERHVDGAGTGEKVVKGACDMFAAVHRHLCSEPSLL